MQARCQIAHAGTWAEYTTAEDDWLATVPANIDISKVAGAVPLVALTAWQVQTETFGTCFTCIASVKS